jgi:hypothetical protein
VVLEPIEGQPGLYRETTMAAKPPWRIVSEIYEALPWPVVVHVFNGTSPAQAQAFYSAHMKSDSFMRGCVDRGRFADFKCRETHRIERWDGRRYVRA